MTTHAEPVWRNRLGEQVWKVWGEYPGILSGCYEFTSPSGETRA
jgi:hypothetical protein